MIGSAVFVMAYLLFTQSQILERPQIPAYITNAVYIAMGIIVGCMFKPELLTTFCQYWHQVVLSMLIILLGGIIGAFLLYKCGLLSPSSAYLAASPGGLNAVVGFASGMDPHDAPLILICHMVRLYTILLTAPLIGKLLAWLFKA